MAGINGLGTTFNLPNFNGTLYGLTPQDTPFASAIGVMSGGGEQIDSKDFEWQTYDLRVPENPSNLEGQDAPTARERVRANVSNVAQIFHSKVSVSYTKLAATGQRDGLNNGQNTAQGNELVWQVQQELKSLKRDMEFTFLNGTYLKPADNTQARKTRGIISATVTNVASRASAPAAITATATTDNVNQSAHGYLVGQAVVFTGLTGGAPLVNGTTYYVREVTANTFKVSATPLGTAIDITTDATAGNVSADQLLSEKSVLDLMQQVWDNGGIQEQESATLMCNSSIKRQLTDLFVTKKGYSETERVIGGVSVQTIITDFGTLNIMLNRYMPTSVMQVVSLEVCKPRTLLIPDKGFLFLEPLAKTGASENSQIYGEVGLEYGNERQHGKITNVSTVLPG